MDLEFNHKWYNQVPDSVLENEGRRILWDFSIQTDKIIEHRLPDIVCLEKIAKSCLIIDIAIPEDQNIIVKEQKNDRQVLRFANRIEETMESKG